MPQNSRRPANVRDLGDGFVGIWVAFEHKDQAKAIPGARWDPNLKCWRVPTQLRGEADRLVDRLNGSVDGLLESALETMFSRIPPTLREATYKALVKCWHPDAGGDTRSAQALNQTWGRLR